MPCIPVHELSPGTISSLHLAKQTAPLYRKMSRLQKARDPTYCTTSLIRDIPDGVNNRIRHTATAMYKVPIGSYYLLLLLTPEPMSGEIEILRVRAYRGSCETLAPINAYVMPCFVSFRRSGPLDRNFEEDSLPPARALPPSPLTQGPSVPTFFVSSLRR